ncbi:MULTISPECIES: glycoside hydrolase family 3 protein [Olivibacter]|jgi:beta-glucosidase-like glycosyl hydrolase|uniref:beta-N-acetylhexosaminidase n=2 Tax=Olivibacter TaxID=376469 RepID=A0ABV6HD87_9SPHI|nr:MULTISPECIES: glycoside hydrolase family 3 protein [Olivibacter]MCL4640112.1 glycoside hydrolase family 3 protein [Olivibacter sp. UJ_SKK_5.1]MDM8178071.1 glycoside hydrolase family 3 protein [Olivibacter sp. 47]MDX3916409.1 glycoside hydrolase family 3 protein [Pseudosphingobacterium sp.]QEK99373.1 glycoside hydrolase family 3 [Olivibacter sp. LS-1]
MVKKYLFTYLFLISVWQSFAQQPADFTTFINSPHRWVDSTFNSLNQNEKIAQLFMVRAHTNLGQRYIDSVAKIIASEKLGGVVFFQGGPLGHAKAINTYQSISKVPLLIALDGEWGLGMRLADSTISYPYQMTLGAIRNEKLLYNMGREIAKDFRRLGLNVNFAPVVDINNNPRNPVINFRSFGENKGNVTRKASAYMRGMMDEHILTTLKHFPGHGDTDVDSHKDLPQLAFSRGRLDSLELFPFKQLIREGASGVMVAHMNIPALDKTPNLPSSLSPAVIDGLLKKELGFKGLVFTDAMDMNGVVKYFKNGEADVRAVIAGNDILELSQNSKRAIAMIAKAIKDKRISQASLDAKVKRILAAKLWLGLDKREPVMLDGLYRELNRSASKKLNQELADAAVTLLKGDSLIRNIDYGKRTAIISIGARELTTFQKELEGKFDNALKFVISPDAKPNDIAKVSVELLRYNQVIVALHDTRRSPQSKINFSGTVRLFINELANMNSIFCVFTNPYALAGMPGIEACKSLVLGYQNSDELQRAGAKVILKSLRPTGRLPVTVSTFFKYGDGL